MLEYWRQNPCVVCGESDPRCLTFDHIDPATKSDTVSNLVGTGAAMTTVMAEIAKCQVLCSNCHAKRTSDQQGYYTSDPKFLVS